MNFWKQLIIFGFHFKHCHTFLLYFTDMPYRCCVGGCDNDSRYPEKMVKRNHVETLKFHRFPKEESEREMWQHNISKGRKFFKASNFMRVCSNHFKYGRPTNAEPRPTLYLVPSDKKKKSPRKRKLRRCLSQPLQQNKDKLQQSSQAESEPEPPPAQVPHISLRISVAFEKMIQDSNVRLFTCSV